MGGVNVGLFVFPTVTVGDREAMIDRRQRHVASEIYAACQAGRIEVLEPPRASAGWDFDQAEPGGRIRQLRPPAHHQSDRITIGPELDMGSRSQPEPVKNSRRDGDQPPFSNNGRVRSRISRSWSIGVGGGD